MFTKTFDFRDKDMIRICFFASLRVSSVYESTMCQPSDRLQFECDLWARRRSAKVAPNVSRRGRFLRFLKFKEDIKRYHERWRWYYEDMKICVLEVGSRGSDSWRTLCGIGRSQTIRWRWSQTISSHILLPSIMPWSQCLFRCLDVGPSFEVFPPKKRETSYSAFDLRL